LIPKLSGIEFLSQTASAQVNEVCAPHAQQGSGKNVQQVVIAQINLAIGNQGRGSQKDPRAFGVVDRKQNGHGKAIGGMI
jgi:hypothetical protein